MKSILCVLIILVSWPVRASFHLMQIEQVIGGVDGDMTAQAVQLRMRTFGENFVGQGRLVAYDAAGASPVILLNVPGNVSHGNAGDHVLLVSSNFVAHTTPATVPDFILINLIPVEYLAAGRLTWEDDFGTINWSLSWGGTNYTGSNAGSLLNDTNGDFGPPFDGALPSSDTNALAFTGGASAQSTGNATDYAVSTGGAIFINNAGDSFTLGAVVTPPPVTHDFAVLRIKSPKIINIKDSTPVTKRVVIQIQNRSAHTETISNLTGLVTLEVQSLGEACTNFDAPLVAGPPNVVPRVLKSKGKLNVFFNVTYDCANDAGKGAGHEDYRYIATVHSDAIDGNADSDSADDVCPRSPPAALVEGPYPGEGGGVVPDRGCGTKTSSGTLGAEVVTDVVVKP